MRISDWSSDVCSSDLPRHPAVRGDAGGEALVPGLCARRLRRAHGDADRHRAVRRAEILRPWGADRALVAVDRDRPAAVEDGRACRHQPAAAPPPPFRDTGDAGRVGGAAAAALLRPGAGSSPRAGGGVADREGAWLYREARARYLR